MAGGAWLDLLSTARRAGAARWLDGRLFEVLGGWVASVPDPEVKVALATQAAHHGWHATLWDERLPTLHGVDPRSWVAPAPGIESVVALVAEAEGTIECLVGVHRVLLPRLAAAHTAHLEATSEVADGPTIRTLRFVLRDEAEDRQRGEQLLRALIGTEDDADRAAAHQARIEARLAGAGPLLG